MKTVFITGANTGIGFETARQMAQLGYFVYLGCRDPEKGLAAVNKLRGLGISNAEMLEIDIADIGSVIKAKQELESKIEALLDNHFNNDAINIGLPTVQSIAGQLNLSPDYLTTLLKVTTGQNTQQLIHEKLINKAKEKLAATKLSVSEIAYQLGFEHSQSFSKLFKTKTNLSPLEFRASFN